VISPNDIIGDGQHRLAMDGIFENRQVAFGAMDELVRPLKSIIDRPMFLHQTDDPLQVFLKELFSEHHLLYLLSFRRRAFLKEMEKGEGDFPLFQIFSERFAEAPAIGDVIEGVIRDLKGHP